MRYKRIEYFFIVGLVLLASCKNQVTSTSEAWPYGTMYEIFVQSFADSNGDGIGDINGMTAKLDYLEDLGIQGIWLMPINPSPSYHKYDVMDYYDIHPDYGTMEDFRRFLYEAHKRNIKVVMDLVLNHTSSEHPWFRDAVSGPDAKYRDYYVWANIDSIRDQITRKKKTLDSYNVRQWHRSDGNDKYYYGFFWRGMPDLNYDNPNVRKDMIKVGKFWLEDIGVDGFRLDAARHIFPNERAEDCHEFWIEFGDAMRSIKPDVYLVGEVWGNAEEVGPYLQGLPSMFNFDFFHEIQKMIKEEKNDEFIENLINTQQVYRKVQNKYIDAIFVNNHDQNRLISNVDGSIQKNKLSAAILLTLPGMPYIYYGDEIGMLGKKPDPEIREPFLWDYSGKAPERTYWIEAVNSTDETVIPLIVQVDDPNSSYNYFKYWIKLRNENEILRTGNLNAIELPNTLLGYARSIDESRWVVVHNLTSESQTINMDDLKVSEVLYTFNNEVTKGNEIALPAFASVIMK